MTPVFFSTSTRVLVLPIFIMPPSPCLSAILRNTNNHMARKIAAGAIQEMRLARKVLLITPVNSTSYSTSCAASAGSRRGVMKVSLPSIGYVNSPRMYCSSMAMRLMRPLCR